MGDTEERDEAVVRVALLGKPGVALLELRAAEEEEAPGGAGGWLGGTKR